MAMQQLELFSTQEFQVLNENVKDYKDSQDRVRRCVFGKVDEVKKEVAQQKTELETLKNMLYDFLKEFNQHQKVI